MAAMVTKQKYRKLYLSKKCRIKNKQSYFTLSGVHTISMGVISSYIERCYHNSLHYLFPSTRFFHERSLVFYAKNTISGNFVEMLLILFCDITICYRKLWVREDILENRVKSSYFTLPFANSRCPLTTPWHHSGANCISAPATVCSLFQSEKRIRKASTRNRTR